MSAVAVVPMSAQAAMDHLETHLDMRNIRMKLADPEEGEGLDSVELDVREREYRRFLALKLMHPDADVVPCKLADEMWHRHILDTRAYADDCQAIFGEFVHHFPYFGLRGPDDAQALQDAYADTLQLYRDAFGEPEPDTWISDSPTRCRTACKPQKCR